MKVYLRDKEKETAFLEFSKLLEEELEKNRQIEQDWEQRKYELSNDYGEPNIDAFELAEDIRKIIFGDNYIFPKHLEYDTDRFGYPILNNYHIKKEDKDYIDFGTFDVDDEDHPGLVQILMARHNLPPSKRVLVG